MSREDSIAKVKKLADNIKKEIPLVKYKRRKIIQEEIVDAYKCPVPSSITVHGRPRQVERDEWVVIHQDGQEACYSADEFFKIFEAIPLGEAFKKEEVTDAETDE